MTTLRKFLQRSAGANSSVRVNVGELLDDLQEAYEAIDPTAKVAQGLIHDMSRQLEEIEKGIRTIERAWGSFDKYQKAWDNIPADVEKTIDELDQQIDAIISKR